MPFSALSELINKERIAKTQLETIANYFHQFGIEFVSIEDQLSIVAILVPENVVFVLTNDINKNVLYVVIKDQIDIYDFQQYVFSENISISLHLEYCRWARHFSSIESSTEESEEDYFEREPRITLK